MAAVEGGGGAGLAVQVAGDRYARKVAQNEDVRQSASGLAGALGDVSTMVQENQHKAALKHMLVGHGADPNEVEQVFATHSNKMIGDLIQRTAQNAQMRTATTMLGMDATGAPAPNSAEAAGFFAPAPGAAAPPVPGASGGGPSFSAPASPDASTPGIVAPPPPRTSTVGGVQMTSPGIAGGLPPTDPSAFPSRQDLLRRYASGVGGYDAGALDTALGQLPPEAKPVDPSEVDLRKSEAERNRAEASRPQAWQPPDEASYLRVHPPVVHEPRNIDPYSPEGIDAAAKRKKAELGVEKEMGAGDFKPNPKTTGARGTKETNFDTPLSPDDETSFQAWKAKYAPQDSGFDYDLRGAFKAGLAPDPSTGHWPDTFKKPNHPTFSNQSIYAVDAPGMAGSWDGDKFIPHQDPLTSLAKGLGVEHQQREAQDYESAEYKRAAKDYELLVETSRSVEKTALYPGGKLKLATDTAAAKARMDSLKVAPARPPLSDAPPPNAPAPMQNSAGPTWEGFN